jgi:hypothetical protein
MNKKIVLLNLIILAAPLFSMESNEKTIENLLTPLLSKWLDTKIQSTDDGIEKVKKILSAQIPVPIMIAENEDWGFSFSPSKFEYIPLSMVAQMFKKTGQTVAVVDLGAGYGYMSLNFILAGGKVDVVEMQRDVADKTRLYIFNNLIDLGFKNLASYCRVFPYNVLDINTTNNWTKTNHYMAFANNLMHWLTPEQGSQLAKVIYDNLYDDGVVVVSSDTPFMDASWLSYYESRSHEKAGAKGYGVYSRTMDRGRKIGLGKPAAVGGNLVPGKVYMGHYRSEDNVIDDKNAYHTVKNYYKKEDLVDVFTNVGFRSKEAYYLDSWGNLVTDESSMEVGKPYRIYVLLIKDPK